MRMEKFQEATICFLTIHFFFALLILSIVPSSTSASKVCPGTSAYFRTVGILIF